MPCLMYFKGVFVSSYGKVVISTVLFVVLFTVGGAKLVVVKCEQE